VFLCEQEQLPLLHHLCRLHRNSGAIVALLHRNSGDCDTGTTGVPRGIIYKSVWPGFGNPGRAKRSASGTGGAGGMARQKEENV